MAAETSSRKGRRDRVGEIRCQNCFSRFRPEQGVQKASCPDCGMEWYVSWIGTLAKIRKPVWESLERHTSDSRPTEE